MSQPGWKCPGCGTLVLEDEVDRHVIDCDLVDGMGQSVNSEAPGNVGGDEGSSEANIPQTSAEDLENGLFSITITLAQFHMSKGMPKAQACETVAGILERYAEALRQQ